MAKKYKIVDKFPKYLFYEDGNIFSLSAGKFIRNQAHLKLRNKSLRYHVTKAKIYAELFPNLYTFHGKPVIGYIESLEDNRIIGYFNNKLNDLFVEPKI